MNNEATIRIWRREDGQLWAAAGGKETMVRIHRCFPWSDPGRHISLRDVDDDEFGYIDDTGQLDDPSRHALEAAMSEAGFLLEITSIRDVTEEVEIRSWSVITRQGERRFQTRLDDWPLQIPGGGLLIRDVGGDLYHVPVVDTLDEASRGWLWAYAG